jgi:hypothetical protein
MRDFMQSPQGRYAAKTWNEENMRAHGYQGLGGAVQYPDGGQ